MADVIDEVIAVLERLPEANDIERTDVAVIMGALFGVIQARRMVKRDHVRKWMGAAPGKWIWCDETNTGTDSEYHAELKVYPGTVRIEFWRFNSNRYAMHAKDVEHARLLCEMKALEAREVDHGD